MYKNLDSLNKKKKVFYIYITMPHPGGDLVCLYDSVFLCGVHRPENGPGWGEARWQFGPLPPGPPRSLAVTLQNLRWGCEGVFITSEGEFAGISVFPWTWLLSVPTPASSEFPKCRRWWQACIWSPPCFRQYPFIHRHKLKEFFVINWTQIFHHT